MTKNRKLLAQLSGAVFIAFLASLVLTWILHDHLTERDAHRLIDVTFKDVEGAIREKVDQRLVREAMLFRDMLPSLRRDSAWSDLVRSSALLRKTAAELKVDELCVANANGVITHCSNEQSVGFDFKKQSGQAKDFLPLLDSETEVTQPIMPNSQEGKLIKYVGVWIPEGGFVQVGCRADQIRHLSRSALVGLTHNRHVSGGEGYVVITTASGTIISHPDEKRESGQWVDPGDEYYWQRRDVEGFPVYVIIPKETAVVERRVLVGTSAFLNAMALVIAAFLVGFVIASYVRSQLRAQRAKEMSMASNIQENAIPNVFPPFPGERRIDLFGDMDPAKDVGGDFYDFYFSGPSKVTFLIADVSDKGVPAALFMMRAKTIIKGIAQTGKPIAEVLTEANDSLCEGNEGANMFVTAWAGEIDLATGVVTFVNAGHNPPIILHADGSAEYLRSKHQLVLAAMSGFPYSSQSVQLSPGDSIYLYTDGITEQTNDKGDLFGEDRLLNVFAGGARYGSHEERLREVLSRVTAHAAGVEQSDDRTQLIIRYNGSTIS